MFRFITKLVLFFALSVGLYAGNGLSQKHLLSVSPEASATDVSADTIIEVVYDAPIASKSVKQHTIILKGNKHKVTGITSLVDDNILVFRPANALESGKYKVIVKQVKLQKANTDKVECEPTTNFEKFIYWFCSLFYDDPLECGWCQYICGDSNNDTIKTKKIKYSFNVKDNSPKPTYLTLSPKTIDVNVDAYIELNTTLHYDDNSSEIVKNGVTYTLSNDDVAFVNVQHGLKASEEGNTTLQAHYKDLNSNSVPISVYLEVDGYRLPLDPGEEGKRTVAGIDANTNGVRDDIERWIYIEMEIYKYPRIERAIAMQEGKALQKILINPENARNLYQDFDKSADCFGYYKFGYLGNKYPIAYEIFNHKYRDIAMNTKARLKAYYKYDGLLAGDIYPMGRLHPDQCDFDIDAMMKEAKK